jgi:chromosome segregation ATPase
MQAIIDALSIYGPGIVMFAISSVAIYVLFQGSIDSLKKSSEALGKVNSRFESEIKILRAELKERREEAQEEREQSKKYQAEVKELGETVSSLENQLKEQNSLIKQLLENVAKLSKEMSSIKEQHSAAVDRIDDIASSIANFAHHLERSNSVDSEVIELLEEQLNAHNLELIRLKEMFEKMSQSTQCL